MGRFPGFLPAGDALAAALKPIVTASDYILGTRLRDCLGCSRRRVTLNKIIPG